MTQKEIVWIFGNSAAGKETFIRCITKETPTKIVHELGWENRKIIACEESIEFVGQFDNDPIVEKRKKIPIYIQKMTDNSDMILIKWQYVDSINNLPILLLGMLPKYRHRIISLQTSNQEFSKRLPKKKAFKRGQNPVKIAEREREMITAELNKLKDKFAIKIIDSSVYRDYKIISK